MIPSVTARELSGPKREYLLRHIDVQVPFDRRSERGTVSALLRLGLIRDAKGSCHSRFPAATTLTDYGRSVVAAILAEYADALVRAGCLEVDENTAREIRPLEMLARLKASWKAQAESFSQANPPKSPNRKNSTNPSSSAADIGR